MIANIAIPGTIGIIRQGITEVLKSLKKVNPHLYKNLGGKRQAVKKEKVYNLNQKEKKEKLVDIVKEAKNMIEKAEFFSLAS